MRRILLALLAAAGLFTLSVAGAASLTLTSSGSTFTVTRSQSIQIDKDDLLCKPLIERVQPVVASGKVSEVFIRTGGVFEAINNCVGQEVQVYLTEKNGGVLQTSSGFFVVDSNTADSIDYAEVSVTFTPANVSYQLLEKIRIVIPAP